jgi:hypothetical protein
MNFFCRAKGLDADCFADTLSIQVERRLDYFYILILTSMVIFVLILGLSFISLLIACDLRSWQ